MSLIEQALRRASAKRAAETKAPFAPPDVTRPVRTGIDSTQPVEVRAFRKGSIDRDTMEKCRIFPAIGDRAALRGYKILRTRVLQRLAANDWRSIGITAPGAGEGKTVTAINLAIALAQDVNTRVFLVDMDLQHPSVAGYLGLSFDRGLSDYLNGTATFDDIVYDVGLDRISVVPNREALPNSSEHLGSPRVLELISALQSDSSRRIVLFDLPPLLLSDDVLTLAPKIDSVLLVVSEGLTNRKQVEDARQILQEMNLLGVMLNRSTERDDGTYY